MLEDFADSLSEKWESFLSWSDESGLPLRSFSDALSERGIPPAPALVAAALLIVLAAGFVVLPFLAPPPLATLSVTVTDSAGPVKGMDVYLKGLSQDAPSQDLFTDADGNAVFDRLPAGDYNLSVSSFAHQSDWKSLRVEPGKEQRQSVSFQAYEKAAQNATLKVDVFGPDAPSTVTLSTPLGVVIGTQFGKSVTFSVPKQNEYDIEAKSLGFSTNKTRVKVESADLIASIYLSKLASENTVDLSLSVVLGENNTPAVSATVQLQDGAFGLTLRTSQTDANGNAVFKSLEKGSRFRVLVQYPDYPDWLSNYVASSSNATLSAKLFKVDPALQSKITCTVTDEKGVKVPKPVVRLYQGAKKTKEQTGIDGVATFDAEAGADYRVTAYRIGYLPGSTSAFAGSQDCKIVLSLSKDNSGQVKVKVTDESENPVTGAVASLFEDAGPLGMPEQVTAGDGMAIFDGVPLKSIYASASANGRQAQSDPKEITVQGEPDLNATLLTVHLLPVKGTLKLTVIDHFTRKPVVGAHAEITTVETATCLTALGGKCDLEVLEGWGQVSVSAPGYSNYVSSQVQVRPNTETPYTAEIVSEGIATSLRGEFLGMFDLNGNRVPSLEPSTTYNARFLLNSPAINFSRGVLHVRLGDASTAASALDAFISGYDGGADPVVTSGVAYTAPAAAAESGQTTATGNTTLAKPSYSSTFGYESDYNSNELKYAEFSYPKFAGTREISVQVTTRQKQNGSVSVGYRTAYQTPNGTFREPVDEAAGKSKDEYLAAVNSTRFPISFGGTCAEGLCLEAIVSSTRGQYSRNFEAQVPEEFTLTVKSIYSASQGFELRVSTNTLITAVMLSGSSSLSTAIVTNESEGQRAVIAVPSGSTQTTFAIKALRPASGLTFSIEANDKGKVVNEISVSGRLLNPANNELKVGFAPRTISALEENALSFTVTDAYGTPITNAHISVGSKNDVFGQARYFADGTGEDGAGLDGKYLIESVNPGKLGSADYSAEAEGYSTFYGSIPVTAKNIITASPAEEFSLTIDTKDGQVETISVTNGLENEVAVSASILLDKTPRIIDTSLSADSLTLEPKDSRDVAFTARISDLVLDVARQLQTVKENLTGKIVLNAAVGKTKQTVSIPFRVDALFVQAPLDDAWQVDEESVDFTLTLGAQNQSNSTVTVTNDLGMNLLVNYQLDGQHEWLSSSPASLVLGPAGAAGGGAIFFAGEENVTAASPSTQQVTLTARTPGNFKGTTCVMDNQGEINTTMTLVASIAGVTSTKKVPVTLHLESESNCAPTNPIDVSLPLLLKADLVSGILTKTNPDSSVAIQFADKTRILFNSPSSLSGASGAARYVTVPSGAIMSLEPSMVSIKKANQEFDLMLPLATTYAIPNYVERIKNGDGTTTFVLQSGDNLTFPLGSSFVTPIETQANFADIENSVKAITSYTALVLGQSAINLAEGDSLAIDAKVPAFGRVRVFMAGGEAAAACKVALTFGQDSELSLPSGTKLVTDAAKGTKDASLTSCEKLEVRGNDGTVLTLPSANKFSFNAASAVSRTTSGFHAKVPASQPVSVSYCSKDEDQDSYELSFTQNITFVFPKNAIVSEDKATFATCEQVVIATSSSTSSLPNARSMEFQGDVERVVDDNGNTAVNVPPGTMIVVNACPCEIGSTERVTISQGITATGGQVLKTDKSALAYNLSDGNLTQSQQLCISNDGEQSLNVSATASNPGTGYEDLAQLGILKDEDLFFSVESTHSSIVAQTHGDCAPFEAAARVPEGLLDSSGCIKTGTNRTYNGLLRFSASLITGTVVSPANLPKVQAFVNIKAGTCQAREREEAARDLGDFFVNYDSSVTDVRTGAPAVLGFKNVGHWRAISLVNNREETVHVKFESTKNAVDCFADKAMAEKFEETDMPPGDVRVIFCKSKTGSEAGTSDSLVFDMGAAGKKTVGAMLYKTDAAALYSSTPLGDVLPIEQAAPPAAEETGLAGAGATHYYRRFLSRQRTVNFADAEPTPVPSPTVAGPVPQYPNAGDGTTDATADAATVTAQTVTADASFIDCARYFCTYDQAKSAYSSFLRNVYNIVTFVGQDDKDFSKRQAALCESTRTGAGQAGAYSKSTVLQLVNTRQSVDFLDSVARESGFVNINVAQGGISELKGCGIYPVTAALDVCNADTTSLESFRNTIKLDVIIDENKVVKCDETLANAALLMGEDPEVVTGNEMTRGFAEVGESLKNVASGNILGGRLRIGVYKDESGKRDAEAATAFLKSGYSSSLPQDSSAVRSSSLYNDDSFCYAHSGRTWIAPGIAVAADVGLLFTEAMTAQAATALYQGVVGCFGSAFVRAAGEETFVCSLVCECPLNIIAAQANLIAPGSSFVADFSRGRLAGAGSSVSGTILRAQNLIFDGGATALGVAGQMATGGTHSAGITDAASVAIQLQGPYNALFNQRARIVRSLRGRGFTLTEAQAIVDASITGAPRNVPFGGVPGVGILRPRAIVVRDQFSQSLDDYFTRAGTTDINLLNRGETDAFVSWVATNVGNAEADEARAVIEGIQANPRGADRFVITDVDIAARRVPFPASSIAAADADTVISKMLGQAPYSAAGHVTLDDLRFFAGSASASDRKVLEVLIEEAERGGIIPTNPLFGGAVMPTSGGRTTFVRLASASEAADEIIRISKVDPIAAAISERLRDVLARRVQGNPAARTALGGLTGLPVGTQDQILNAFSEIERQGGSVEDFLKGQRIYSGPKVADIISSSRADFEALGRSSPASRIAPSLDEFKKVSGSDKLRTGASAALMLGTLLATDCDFRPAQTLVNPDALNHFVFFSKKQDKEPSTYKVCVSANPVTGAQGETLEEASGSCAAADDLCPQDRQYCLGIAKSGKIDDLQGYALFSGVDQDSPADGDGKLFDSVFNSAAPPLEKSAADRIYRPSGAKGAFQFING